MLCLLLDEHISQVVLEQIRTRRPDVCIKGLFEWHDGEYMGVADESILLAARDEGLTLVTYDKQILSELPFLFASGTSFSGLIFVDKKTIANSDFGALVRSLIYLWDLERDSVWHNRLMYLPTPPV